MKVERHVLQKISLHEIIRDISKFSLKSNVLKVHCQSNPKVRANSETKTFKNISNRGLK